MNDKHTRIALIGFAVVVSAFVLRGLVTGATDEGGTAQPDEAVEARDAGPANTGPAAADAFDPLQGGRPLEDAPTTASPQSTGTAPGQALERREVGPPLPDGTPVDLAVKRVPGTVTRYRITNAIAQRDRQNDQSVGQRWIFEVTTTVSGVEEDGSSRVRLEVDAIRIQALYPDGLQIDFDSRRPDDEALADPRRAITIKPLIAVIGIPVEFGLAPNGGCTTIEGLDAWHDAWAETVEALDPGASRKNISPYTAETTLFEWSEYLFPPILGGTLVSGGTRDVQILRDTLQSAYVEFRGPLRVTHDDGDVFRLELVTTPGVMMREGGARSAQEAAVARVHVQSDADAYYAAWRFQREPGRLLDAEIDTKYQMWVAWRMGQDAGGEQAYQRVFLDIERGTRVELLTNE